MAPPDEEPPKPRVAAPAVTAGPPADSPRRVELEQALRKHRGDTVAAAEELGLSRSQVYRRARSMGLKISDYRH